MTQCSSVMVFSSTNLQYVLYIYIHTEECDRRAKFRMLHPVKEYILYNIYWHNPKE